MRKTISLILVILTVVTTVFSAVGTAAYAAQVDDFGYAETGADYPVITAVEPCAEGVVVNWSRADGIGYYRVYRLHETRGWVALGDTNKLYYIDSNVRDGNTYLYIVDENENIYSARYTDVIDMILKEEGDTVTILTDGDRFVLK